MNHDAVDFTRIRETSDGDRDFELELFQMYLEDTASRVQKLQAAIAKGDLETCRHEAHAIKGSSANVGATRLARIAQELELCNPATDLPTAKARFAELETEFEAVTSVIEQFLETQS